MMFPPEFAVGCIILIAGTLATAFPRDRVYLTRLINLEIAEFGFVLIMLAFSEMLALVTFIAVNIVTTLILVRVIEKKEAAP
jgi:energy-converting hydrogenase A subunit E